MPEFGPSNAGFEGFRKLRKAAAADWAKSALAKEAKAHIEQSGLTLLGQGTEHVVVEYGSDKVAALGKYSAERDGAASIEKRRIIFYSHKILHILFPQNFPAFHAIFGRPLSPKHMGEGTVRGRVRGGHEMTSVPIDSGAFDSALKKFTDRAATLEPYGFRILGALDARTLVNFQHIPETDEAVYMDHLNWPIISSSENVESLIRYMEDYGYDASDIKRAKKYAERIVKLAGRD